MAGRTAAPGEQVTFANVVACDTPAIKFGGATETQRVSPEGGLPPSGERSDERERGEQRRHWFNPSNAHHSLATTNALLDAPRSGSPRGRANARSGGAVQSR